MVQIKVLTGSVRPGRFNIQPAEWIYKIIQKRSDCEVKLVDLQKVDLPFLDEPAPPSQHKYTKDHTKQWSKQIDEADGFVFVTPEYNHSYSPVLKNAIDFLWYEWNSKPVSFVSYGSLAGGARAVEHLRTVAAEVEMFDLRRQILIPNYWDNLDSQGNYKFTSDQKEQAEKMLDDLVFWAKNLRPIRQKLAKNE